MKKSYFFKFFVMAVLAAFVTITSCKDYEDDISRLNTDLAAMKSDAVAKSELAALQTQLQSSITTTASDLAAAKASLATLQANSATQAKIDAAKAEILAIAVKTETLTAMKTQVDAELATLKGDLAKAPTKEYVNALVALTDSQIDSVALALSAKIANLEAILKVADGKSQVLDGLQSQLTAQLAEITANKAAIEATKADLLAKYNEVKAEIAALKADLDNLEANLAALDTKVEGYKTALEKSIADLRADMNNLIFDVFDSLDKRVTSLTFIPDFSSPDGTPQLPVTFLGEWYKPEATVQNWDPDYRSDIMLTPYKGITYVKYHVSPSNATLADFEVVGLLNKSSEVLFRSSTGDPLMKAVVEDVTLNNGILTVPVLIHADLYDNDDFGHDYKRVADIDNGDDQLLYRLYDKNFSVALQVKNKNMEGDDDTERLVVSSAYINTQLSLMFARIEAFDEEDEDYELGDRWQDRLPSRMLDNIIDDTYRRPEIELWNGYNRNTQKYESFSINLNDYVQAIGNFNHTWRLLEDFGYDNIEDHFVYELISVDNEGVDQSSYVTLNSTTGVISVKPAQGGGANQASVGRTPVVLAKVVKNGKVYAAGYIKILITEAVDNSPIAFEFNLEDYMIGCDSEYKFTNVDLSETDFDQIFNHPRVMLGKDAFFTAYRTPNAILTEVISAPAGTDGTEISFNWNITEPTQGLSLDNYINGFVKNTAPAGVYKVKTTLKGKGITPDIEIIWTIKVKLPAISLTANTAILANGKIVVNPTIIEQNGKTSAAYEALLNNAFMHQAGAFIFTPLPASCDNYLTPYFVFTSAPTGYKVAASGKEIWTNANVLAARIDVDPSDAKKFYVRLNEETPATPGVSIGNYPPLSEASKGLVGKTVSVQPKGYINGAAYNNINLYNAFNVEFVTPLYLVLPTNAAVYDQANNGNNVYALNMYDPSVLKDWNGKLLDVTTADGRALINHYEAFGYVSQFLAGWTEILNSPQPGATWHGYPYFHWHLWHPDVTTETFTSPFQFDLAGMKSSIRNDGTIDPTSVNYPIPAGMKLKISAAGNTGTTTVVNGAPTTVPATYVFEWDNGSTGAIQNAFKVSVPVSVKHKWGELKSTLVISVNPGAGPAPAPAP